jgi:hypothetical protein
MLFDVFDLKVAPFCIELDTVLILFALYASPYITRIEIDVSALFARFS